MYDIKAFWHFVAFDLTLLASITMCIDGASQRRSSILRPLPFLPSCLSAACIMSILPRIKLRKRHQQLLPLSDPCGIVFVCATALGRPAGHKVLSAAVLLIGDTHWAGQKPTPPFSPPAPADENFP